MGTTVAPPVPLVERRRPYPAAARGLDFVERRRPAPVLLRHVDDLHEVAVLADQLAFGVSAAQALDAAVGLAEVIGATGPAAFAAHDLSQAAETFAA